MITPQQKAPNLANNLGLGVELYLKREDQHPYGSHKGRSIPRMIYNYAAQGEKNFVISSSGNAAIAAVRSVKEYNLEHKSDNIRLNIFVGHNIASNKLESLKKEAVEDASIIIKQVINPKQQAFLAEKSKAAKNLRQSTDDFALRGYEELADELAQIIDLSAIFIPTSSGTTAEGLSRGFKSHGRNPQIHIVQTDTCHPFITGTEAKTDEASLASAIVDKIGHRKRAVLESINNSGGHGWIANNREIIQAARLVKQTENIEISPNSALSIVGIKKAIENGFIFNGPVVCLITGE